VSPQILCATIMTVMTVISWFGLEISRAYGHQAVVIGMSARLMKPLGLPTPLMAPYRPL
jgi:5,10-methylene-tetrahydrofolate dehydrogenase/methenyl tetrahydrofolate cyclohydrolase